jgi:hypothetical protein
VASNAATAASDSVTINFFMVVSRLSTRPQADPLLTTANAGRLCCIGITQ